MTVGGVSIHTLIVVSKTSVPPGILIFLITPLAVQPSVDTSPNLPDGTRVSLRESCSQIDMNGNERYFNKGIGHQAGHPHCISKLEYNVGQKNTVWCFFVY